MYIGSIPEALKILKPKKKEEEEKELQQALMGLKPSSLINKI